jgi:hypothetical protein
VAASTLVRPFSFTHLAKPKEIDTITVENEPSQESATAQENDGSPFSIKKKEISENEMHTAVGTQS